MTIQNRHKVAKQGDLDGACGFYAVVNAIHLLERELDNQDVFRLVFKAFLEDGDPMRFIDGTNRGAIKKILSRVLKELHKDWIFTLNNGNEYTFNFEIPFWEKSKIRTRPDVLKNLEIADYRHGHVFIMGYTYNDGSTKNSHWTVIKKCTDSCLHTFDSSGEDKKISFDSIRVDDKSFDKHIARPYNIDSGDLFHIYRK
jgi:hypothetical protein